MHAHFAQGFALFEAGHSFVEHELHHLSFARIVAFVELANEDRRVGVRTIRDERLRTTEYKLVAVATSRCLHRAEGIAAGVRFRDRPRTDLFKRCNVARPTFALRDRAFAIDRRGRETNAHAHRGDHARRTAAKFDDRQHRHARAPAGSAFFIFVAHCWCRVGTRSSFFTSDPLVEGCAGHRVKAKRFIQLAQDVVGRHVAVFEFLAVRTNFFFDEVPHGAADHLVFFRPFKHGTRR